MEIGIFGKYEGEETGSRYGPEKVVYGGFDDPAKWNCGLNVVVTGSKLVFTGVTNGIGATQNIGLVINKKYFVNFTISNLTSGGLRVFSGATQIMKYVNGVYSVFIVSGSSGNLYLGSSGVGTFKVDDVSVREVFCN